MRDLIIKAKEFSAKAHEGQLRKYTGQAYYTHVSNVAHKLGSLGITCEHTIAAAYLHDTVEDCGVYLFDIYERFGEKVAMYVDALTNRITAKDFPQLNRHERHQLYNKLLEFLVEWYSPWDAYAICSIKLADLIDNTSSIVQHDRKFAAVYLKEKAEILPILKRGNSLLFAEASAILEAGLKEIENAG